jgi:hypothetical protein
MKDSLQKISHETLLTLMDEQTKQVKATGKKPSFKKLIADAIEKCYK